MKWGILLISLSLANAAFASKERALPWAQRVVERNAELQKPSLGLAASKLAIKSQTKVAAKAKDSSSKTTKTAP